MYIGVLDADPKLMNDQLSSFGLKKFSSIPFAGADIAWPVGNYFTFGIRYVVGNQTRDESPPNFVQSYQAKIDNKAYAVTSRVAFLQKKWIRADVLAGVGLSSTNVEVTSATTTGSWSLTSNFPYYVGGASLALGYDHYFLVVEGGYVSNKITDPLATGTGFPKIDNIDLSGTYMTVGLLYTGPRVASSGSKKK
jgi:hypothetical protein